MIDENNAKPIFVSVLSKYISALLGFFFLALLGFILIPEHIFKTYGVFLFMAALPAGLICGFCLEHLGGDEK